MAVRCESPPGDAETPVSRAECGSGLGCDRGPAIGVPSSALTRAEASWLAAQEMSRESRPWDEPKLGERHAGRAHAGRGQRVLI